MTAAIDAILAHADDTAFAVALSNYTFAKAEAVGFAALRPAEQVAYCIDGLERDVNNGGFSQFFWNTPGDHSRATIAALESIGAAHTAALLRRACSLFPGAMPSEDRAERWVALRALPPEAEAVFEELDDAFYDYEDDLSALLRQYVVAHRGEFVEG